MTETHKQTVREFLDLVFNDKDPAAAFARYVHPDYVQHNPHAPDGAAASASFLGGFLGQFPELRLEIKRVFADGDHVITHCHMRLTPESRGSAIMDIVRLRDGLIAEHWDVAQDVPESPANGNTMF
ncbi:nuclear transport factor 2 family protein [Crossiella cryophila]|uniref:Putative SnoaL-like aldol condensation-catalyzing enzyme n=1 Tax=Crossiella cryophila TaxID=43355 RepID=A0A7W7C7Y3_9PSEU|nr:nuclear transport factor 2 family protein [Crossiella cryophila]MBB4676195.1 putative SnoaL-like aldol condensation-catalyzing enzyme [Crossiella cryophila]